MYVYMSFLSEIFASSSRHNYLSCLPRTRPRAQSTAAAGLNIYTIRYKYGINII